MDPPWALKPRFSRPWTGGTVGPTCALVLPVDVLQLEALVTLADVAPERVDALPEPGARRPARRTLVHVWKQEARNKEYKTKQLNK